MSSDGEGPARASASPARRGHSGGSDQSQSPPAPGAMGGNNSDNDARSVGSDTGKANDDDEDLFGSESEAGDDKPARTLDDEELDSGDDVDRYDRAGDPMDYEQGDEPEYGETLNVMDLGLGRVSQPESQDGEVYTMNVPSFLTIESEDFNPETYVAPPFNTAATSLCWRFDPSDDTKIQSNCRIVRWSDGSLTLQLASSPQEQYRMPSKRLAPKATAEYDPNYDAHTYLGAAAESASVFRITSHLTSSLAVQPTAVESDDAVERLKQSLAAATRGSQKNADGSVAMFDVKEDPELAKKQAELAEREKLRAARKRQAAVERDLDRGRRVGLSSRSGGAGLTVGGLEDDIDGMATTKARGAQKSRRGANRRGEIYSDEEDYGRRGGHTREDEYDEDDGFMVGDDVEPEMEDADDDEEEEEEEEDAEGELDEETKPSKAKDRSSEEKGAPEGAETGDTGAGSPPVRKKHRYIVDDDEDDE